MELQVASHFAQKRCELSWATGGHGHRIPEFVVRRGGEEWDVECKTKGSDAGRRVTRPAFYRLVDSLAPLICDRGFQGTCEIRVPNRLPAEASWRAQAVSAVTEMMSRGETERRLNDGSELSLYLKPQNGTLVTTEEQASLTARNGVNNHVALYGPMRNGKRVDPVILDVASKKPDAYLADVLDDLRDASRQLSGSRAGLICCFVPEIDSFEGLEKASALQAMTIQFFEKHAPPFVHSVVFSSGRQSERIQPRIERTFFPALRFENPRTTFRIPIDALIGV